MDTKQKNLRQKIIKGIKVIFIFILTVVATGIIAIIVMSPGKTESYRDKQGKVLEGSVSEITRKKIGGVEQGMILKGKSDKNPILLFLHGGPGTPEYVFFKEHNIGLEDKFTVCWWDQRGAGMSYDESISADTMNLEQLISDTVEVTNYLRKRFGQEKIYLMGHSWGTFLGVETVSRNPELYNAYIGTGQMVNAMDNEKMAYDYMINTATKNNDKEMLQELQKFPVKGEESLTEEYFEMRGKTLNKLGSGLTHKPTTNTTLMLSLLRFKEYTINQKINFTKSEAFAHPVMDSIRYLDLFEEVPKLDVPVYILQGLHDYQTSYPGAKAFYDKLKAPTKKFYTFDDSAHTPIIEEPEKFMRILVEDVLGEK
ncbi:hypothetical protein ATZ33_00715 [Enterococcus silesiacus]|uniref:Hydrolase or acyltransferase of alpha/beta superfamily n=1 Tax=Enterococcus silesiacus TaxID=332949 RepID=A0A0S3K6V5_9ENTE|nr:alpha/beta hydrolase [Enterococcus silesiacus]ALR99953.1 hypothetical protein ATZ33_00715 [Enterococcus silesiacus]OJG92739.1 hydrolase or acyltransferase of alpha/beta superfamily [Enterococcus silesiacus]